MKTSLFLIAVVSAQIASAQYYTDGSPRINRQLRGRGLEVPAPRGNPYADETNSPTDSLPSSKSEKV